MFLAFAVFELIFKAFELHSTLRNLYFNENFAPKLRHICAECLSCMQCDDELICVFYCSSVSPKFSYLLGSYFH